MKKENVLILSFLIFLPFFCSANRPTEVIYPDIPGVTMTPTTIETALPDYFQYVFGLAMSIIGIICFGSLLYGGVIFVGSAGNPMVQKKAKSQISASIIGGLITLGSYLIGNTINPTLVVPHTGIKTIAGVTLYEEADCPGGGGFSYNNPVFQLAAVDPGNGGGPRKINITTNNQDIGFDAKSFWVNSPPEELKVTLYQESGYKGGSFNIDTSIQGCQNITTISSTRSISISWAIPGVYLCTDEYVKDGPFYYCQGEEKLLPANTDLLSPEFNNNIKGVRFRGTELVLFTAKGYPGLPEPCGFMLDDQSCSRVDYDTKTNKCKCIAAFSYSAILHQNSAQTGQCQYLEGRLVDEIAYNLADGDYREFAKNGETTSVTTLIKGQSSGATPSGGIWLCKNPDPTAADLDNPDKCLGPYKTTKEIKSVKDEIGEDWDNALSSIHIEGNYTAILFEEEEYGGICQIFDDSDSNFRNNPIGRCNCIYSSYGCEDCTSSFMLIPRYGN